MNIAKEYLKQVETLDAKIQQKKIELDSLKGNAIGLGAFDYSKEKVQTSASESISGKIAKYVDFERELQEDIVRFAELKHRVINQIHSLNNPIYMKILFKKYIEYKGLKEISEELGYSYDHIRRYMDGHC
ncbi:hypothetical protein DXB01_10010 [Clostridium sp. OF10-22XD]|nr:hypothetical protein DXB01_10010 [Clostridium sp. OF10-22XD]